MAPKEQVEARVAEAIAWDWLVHRVDSMASGSRADGPRPDFRCRVGDRSFSLEVVNICRSAMTEVTGLEDGEIVRFKRYGSAADRLHKAIQDKAGQGLHVQEPYFVFVTTLHRNGSQLLVDRRHLEVVLHSPTSIRGWFDPDRGEVVGPVYEASGFRRAAFTKSGEILPWRRHVSGVLFGPFGLYPQGVRVHGILNPEATHSFDPRLLADAPFCRFLVWPPDPRIVVAWTDEAAKE
jgi:hypothetical protein